MDSSVPSRQLWPSAGACLAGWILLTSCAEPTALGRLRSSDEGTAQEAILELTRRGEAAIPELKALLDDSDPLVRQRAKTALGRITGQWGSDGSGILWKRSLAEAVGRGKPILLLQLFGSFDQELC